MLRNRRDQAVTIKVETEHVILRDQAPLNKGNIRFENGWSFAKFVEHLNRHVFFWSGWKTGPISYGVRQFQRYCSEQPVILRCSFRLIRGENPGANPFFCKYNSGSPRCSNGQRSARGATTFSTAQNADFTPGNVVEVVFHGSVILPPDTEYKNGDGRWRPLYEAAQPAAGADR
jgi:uncharacterized protein DUF7002